MESSTWVWRVLPAPPGCKRWKGQSGSVLQDPAVALPRRANQRRKLPMGIAPMLRTIRLGYPDDPVKQSTNSCWTFRSGNMGMVYPLTPQIIHRILAFSCIGIQLVHQTIFIHWKNVAPIFGRLDLSFSVWSIGLQVTPETPLQRAQAAVNSILKNANSCRHLG